MLVRSWLFGLMLTNLVAFGQPGYTPLISEDKVWIERNTFTDREDIRPPRVSYVFSFFMGDTLVHTQHYHKLYSQLFYVEDWYNSQAVQMINDTLQQPRLSALLREDTSQQQVFHYQHDEQEYLVYDFSLQPSDTFFFIDTHVVDSIGEVILPNGNIHRQFFFSSPGAPSLVNSYIEGIGGSNGLVQPFDFLAVSGATSKTEIICYTEKEEMLFGICEAPSYVTVGQEDLSLPSRDWNMVELFPNPADNYIRLNIGKPMSHLQFTLLNSNGGIVNYGLIPPVRDFSIDVSDLSKGFYFMVIWDREKMVQFLKFSVI